MAGSRTISALAAQHGVSRKFDYAQTDRARAALEDAFASAVPEDEVLSSCRSASGGCAR
ncbi:hypothetical protein BSU04_27490 [Caballeronia sordidicola]|uniref:Uncharacterized protein n=1 Tax=Caballeronia sordidicola TaxID=196367 RepID=A0A226WVW2_CABSO|nr:hypothetical protein BSU04_27490 [Caballeronia sordidicola]